MKIIFIALLASATTACQNQTNQDAPNNSAVQSEITNPIKACSKDLKSCENGRSVGRNPANNCAFHACKKPIAEPMMCTQEVKQCQDGSYVGRDSYNHCAFSPCPEGDSDLDLQ